MSNKDLTITPSNGNIFADLGFDPAEAAVLAMRSQLMCDISKQISVHGWTQTQAAEYLHISQSRVSDLIRGKFDKFSLDTLVQLAARIGNDVRIELAAAA